MRLILAAVGGVLLGAAAMRAYDLLRERRRLRAHQARLALERAERVRRAADEQERQALRGAHRALGELARTTTLCHFARSEAARRTGRPYHSAAADDLEWRRRLDLCQQEVDQYGSLLMRSGLRRMLGQLRAACQRAARCEDAAEAERLHARAVNGIRVAQEMIGARLAHLEHQASATSLPSQQTGIGGEDGPTNAEPAS
jgi:hypothetical protein